MLAETYAFLEPFVATSRPNRLVLVRRFLLALERALRSDDERAGACNVAGTVFGMPASVLNAAGARGLDAFDHFLARALTEHLVAAPEGLDKRVDWLIRWGPLVEALVPEGPHGASPVPDMVTLAPDLAALFARLSELARSPLPLVIEGQSGTGRESLARAIHGAHRAPRPFVSVDARQLDDRHATQVLFGTALVGGLFGEAADGTLFIRNAESLTVAAQHQIARCLELGAIVGEDGRSRAPMRCRLIFSAGEGALDAAGPGAGTMDSDFAYRAATLYCRLPPLAERGEDLAALYRNVVRRFVLKREKPLTPEDLAQEPRMMLTPRALLALYAYGWPGNVTEFVAVVREARQRAASGPVELVHLPERVVAALGRKGDRPEDRLRALLVDIAPAAVGGADHVARARRRIRRWLDGQLETILERDTIELIGRAIAGFNALRAGQHDPLPLEQVHAQVRAAAAREVLLPAAASVPLFWDERAELVTELEAIAAASGMAGAISRRLFDLGRALVLYPQQAIAQLTPVGSGQEQKPSALTLSLVEAGGEG
jgi:DNA-binding NtrC family response regulator